MQDSETKTETLEQKLRALGDGEHIVVLRKPGTSQGQPVIAYNRGKARPKIIFTLFDKKQNARFRTARGVFRDGLKSISPATEVDETRTTSCTTYVGIHDRRIEAAISAHPASVIIIDTDVTIA